MLMDASDIDGADKADEGADDDNEDIKKARSDGSLSYRGIFLRRFLPV